MSKQPGFNVRMLLAVTTVSAVVFAAMAAPSPRWVTILTLGGMAIIAYGIQRIFIAPASRPLWLSYFGAMIFLIAVMSGYHDVMTVDSFGFYIAGPLWELFHGEQNPSDQVMYERFVNFTFYLRIILVVGLPAIVAYSVTFLSGDRDMARE